MRVILTDQIDQRLIIASEQIIQRLSVSASNVITTRGLLDYAPPEGQIFQVWQETGELSFSRPFSLRSALDSLSLQSGMTEFSSVDINGHPIRVLTVPVTTARGSSAILQIGMDMEIVDFTIQTLAVVLGIIVLIAVILAAMLTNLMVSRNLATLIGVTATAKEITDTNDLSRRIPVPERTSVEIDQIVESFNGTLAQLETLLNSQKRLLADVSHELRTPLTVIKGEVGFIRKYKQIDDEAIKAIESEVDRLTRLVGNLLMLAKAETGDLPMDFAEFALDELLCEVFQQMKTLANERIDVCMENLDQVSLFGDRDRIKQVLLNLVWNAIQYTRDKGRVCVALYQKDGMALIKVKDNGPGISKKDLENIFDRFFRGEKSRNRSKSSGFGLGLSISKYIVDQHDGEIQVNSVIDEGTEFCVILPIKKK